MDKNTDKPLYVYKASASESRFAQFLGVLMLLILIPFLIGASSSDSLRGLIVFVSPLILGAIYFMWMFSAEQSLAVYENGLEYRFRKSRLFSRWEDLQRFEDRGTPRRPVRGISTAKLEKDYRWNTFDRVYFGSEEENFIPFFIVALPTRIINPQQFEKTGVGYVAWPDKSERVIDTAKFAETKFGRELLHYAPQLFEATEEKAKNG
jgi:hypothetical protein